MSVGSRRWAARALELLVLFAIYAATAELGLSFDALGKIATTVWPPTGIALAVMFLRGVGLWPAVVAAAFAVNVRAGIPLWGAAIIATGNTLEAVLGATLLRRAGFDSRLERLGDVFRLVGLAALVSPVVSATLGLLAAELGHVRITTGAPAFWAVWWVGDALGDLLVGAFLFAWASFPRLSRSPLRWIEAALLALLLSFVSATLFRHAFAWRAIHGIVRGTYPTVPLLVWAALRFEQRGVTAAMLLVSGIAVSGAAAGNGIFAAESPHERLLLVQSYMAVTAVSMLTLAAALAERRAAIRARDEFISIASHELKTPLTALKLRLGSALRHGEHLRAGDLEAQKMARALAASGATADRLGALVDDLLDVSRLTAGRLALRIERVELGELLRDVVGRLRDQAEEVGSTIELTIAAPIVGIWDRGRLEQVVTNLLSNAIKYGLGRPVAVSADVVAEHLRVRVHDAGLGIPRADQSRIFQAFERLPTAERVGGLGLGLYIGRQIAMAHGGTLTVESTAGAGATFTLELPLEARAPAAR
jgi:signal transduction histidine kinase